MGLTLPALRFEAEAFRLGKDKILGRQSAGDAFLRALVSLPELEQLWGYGPSSATAPAFAATVGALRKGLRTGWVAGGDRVRLSALGGVHYPDPMLAEPAKMRLAAGPAAWSITGITHTIASGGAMAGLASYATAPLMEWDGLVLTSDAVKASVVELLDAQDDYLAWRFPGAAPAPRPQMPVIPLGVHTADFAVSEAAREEARRALGLGRGDVAFLFVGRLSFHAKAHPWPMYTALEEAARRTGKRIALIQCGWFANAGIEQAFKAGAATHAPSVRHLWLDGREAAQRARAWAAGDVFVSLSDNIQETFGLTPLEAMAAGMPVLATDWNGYRQTVRHGETGFMVPTLAPDTGIGDTYADDHADGAINYDIYLARTARHVSIDLAALFDAAERLATDADLRRTMGAAGRRMARERFEWSGLVRDYLALWDDLARIRAKAQGDPRFAPRRAADRLNPYALFGTYPSAKVSPETRMRRRAGGGDLAALLADPLHAVFVTDLGGVEAAAALLAHVPHAAPLPLSGVAAAAGQTQAQALALVTLLLKLGVVEAA